MSSAAVLKVMAEVYGEVRAVAVEVLVEAHANLVEANPVDTGFSAACWLAGIGTPDTRVAGSPDSIDTSAGPASVADAVRTYRPEMGSLFLSNHADYISDLWNGSSAQASPGWGEGAVDQAVATVAARSR